jgi:ATP-dependent DNA helicase DinG
MTQTILDYFPKTQHIKGPRKGQRDVLNAIDKAFKDGYKNVLLEAPVGSGKSAIAVTASNYYGRAHILTPRKSLQDQYLDDFKTSGIALMKGRNAYPCTYPSDEHKGPYEAVIKLIQEGGLPQPKFGQRTCDKGECKNNVEAYNKCTGSQWDSRVQESIPGDSPCPYHVAIDVAQRSSTIIHNLHSFIFQSYFAGRFDERDILIIDECHEIEDIVRGFAEVKLTLKMLVPEDDIPTRQECSTLDAWGRWLEQFADKFSQRERADGTTERSEFLETIQRMTVFSDSFGEEFVMKTEEGADGKSTRFIFIPKNIGHLVSKYLLNFGQKRLLMSGTIYNKAIFCQKNGLVESETCFMRIGSSFPVSTRPIVFKDDYKVDTSHKTWDVNFKEMVQKIQIIMDAFEGAKGLIHTPSYQASLTLFNALKHTDRVVMHTKDDFHEMLSKFYSSESPDKVFLSPICQQGVDFKYDRARFQIILRVPFANTSDPFIEYLVKEDFPGYNYRALVIFGQQIGRINRADDDYGATFLMDERFGKFLSRNKSALPKWLNDAVILK